MGDVADARGKAPPKSQLSRTTFKAEEPTKTREKDWSNALRGDRRRTEPASAAQEKKVRTPSSSNGRVDSPRRNQTRAQTAPGRESPRRPDSVRRKDNAPNNSQQRPGFKQHPARSQTRQLAEQPAPEVVRAGPPRGKDWFPTDGVPTVSAFPQAPPTAQTRGS